MDRIPLLVLGHEPDWLAQQVADVFRSLPANVQYVLMDHCPERSPPASWPSTTCSGRTYRERCTSLRDAPAE